MNEPLSDEQLDDIREMYGNSSRSFYGKKAIGMMLREVERLKAKAGAAYQVIDALNITSANASAQQATEIAVLQNMIERLKEENEGLQQIVDRSFEIIMNRDEIIADLENELAESLHAAERMTKPEEKKSGL